MITETITELPIAPSTSDPVNFRSRADSFLAALNTFAPEMNTVISEINSTAETINDAEISAVQAKDAAVASANFLGTWSSATAYTVGQSVYYSGIIYRALQGGTNKQPDTQTAYWASIATASEALLALINQKAPLDNPSFTGNIGVGVTPSAWGGSFRAVDIGNGALARLGSNTTGILQNAYFDGTNYRYKANGEASMLQINGGTLYYYTAVSGIAGNAITWVEAARIDVNGLVPNKPSFRAYRGTSTQSISQNVHTKVQFNTEVFDTANAFDSATNFRFTPQKAGYYNVMVNLLFNNVVSTQKVAIYKNGAIYEDGSPIYNSTTSGCGASVSSIVYLNGTTDYIEAYAWTNTAGQSVYNSNGSSSTFQASLI